MGKSLTTAHAALVASFVMCGIASTSRAQSDADAADDPAQGADSPAIAHYVEGERHYAAGRYERAIEEFEAAFELSGKPELHFNIANCHERAGNYEAAAESLEKFIASGKAPNAEVLRERIWRARERASNRRTAAAAQIEESLAEERRRHSEEETAQPAVTPAPEPVAPTEEARASSTPSRAPAYVVLGVGLAATATALAFAGMAHDAGGDAERSCDQQLCKRDAEGALDRERRFARLADISGLVGLAALGVGGYLWYRSGSGDELRAVPTASKGSIGLALDARF